MGTRPGTLIRATADAGVGRWSSPLGLAEARPPPYFHSAAANADIPNKRVLNCDTPKIIDVFATAWPWRERLLG